MSYQLNKKLKELTPYEPIEGDYSIHLDANESFITLPPDVLEKATLVALKVKSNRYPDPYAKRLCETFGKLYGIKSYHLTAGNGSDEIISLIAGSFFLPGEEFLTLSHDFSMYRCYGEIYGTKTSIFPKNADLTVNIDSIIEYINRAGVRGLIFSNPCNPTSLCLDKKEVLRLVRSVPNCLVIVDEAYMDFADDSVLDEIEDYDNLIVLKTCSKAFGMAAIRLGFAVANENITKVLHSVKSPYNVNSITQSVGCMIMSDGDYLIDCIGKIIRSRDRLYAGIMSVYARYKIFDKVYPTSTNFVFIKTNYANMIYNKLLSRSIAVRLMGDYLRITAGSKKENDALLDALDSIAKELEG